MSEDLKRALRCSEAGAFSYMTGGAVAASPPTPIPPANPYRELAAAMARVATPYAPATDLPRSAS